MHVYVYIDVDSLPARAHVTPTTTHVKSPLTYLSSVVNGTPLLSVIMTGISLNLGPDDGVGCCITTIQQRESGWVVVDISLEECLAHRMNTVCTALLFMCWPLTNRCKVMQMIR